MKIPSSMPLAQTGNVDLYGLISFSKNPDPLYLLLAIVPWCCGSKRRATYCMSSGWCHETSGIRSQASDLESHVGSHQPYPCMHFFTTAFMSTKAISLDKGITQYNFRNLETKSGLRSTSSSGSWQWHLHWKWQDVSSWCLLLVPVFCPAAEVCQSYPHSLGAHDN